MGKNKQLKYLFFYNIYFSLTFFRIKKQNKYIWFKKKID